jgi:tungstate transport system ATP-binding protein
MNNAIFTLHNLTKRYGNKETLNISKLEINKGQIYSILGPNGAGKSTLLRIMNLLEESTSGEMYFNQSLIPKEKSKRLLLQREMVMVLQKTIMFSNTVIGNVMYGLKVRGINAKDAKKRALEVLDMVGMKEFADQPANTLSGGEAQRVAIARAIVLKPKVIFLDEPTANLDPNSVLVIEELIKKINADWGTTIVIITHNLYQARRISHKAIILNHGSIVEIGTTEEIFTKPTNPWTQKFIAGELVY